MFFVVSKFYVIKSEKPLNIFSIKAIAVLTGYQHPITTWFCDKPVLSILAKCLYLSFPTFITHVSYSISTLLLVSFIHFHARFSSGKGRAGSIPRRTINTSR